MTKRLKVLLSVFLVVGFFWYSTSLRSLVKETFYYKNSSVKEKLNISNMDTQEKKWFTHTGCTSLEIQKHKSISEHEIVASVLLTDPSLVKSFIDRIEKFPTKGDMFISLGEDAESIELIFTCEQGVQKVEIYNGGFKTPSTAFNVSGNQDEKALYDEILGYLSNSK
jgi:hypothetical protein